MDREAERAAARLRLADHIAGRGITDVRVLDAMARVPREAFVPRGLADNAYQDSPLPIGFGQTISQPYIVACMTEALALRGTERVLDVGTGSGYQAAILAELAAEVFSIEVIPELAERAAATLGHLGYTNVHVVTGDGSLGLDAHAPFDAILVAGGGDPWGVSRQELGKAAAAPRVHGGVTSARALLAAGAPNLRALCAVIQHRFWARVHGRGPFARRGPDITVRTPGAARQLLGRRGRVPNSHSRRRKCDEDRKIDDS